MRIKINREQPFQVLSTNFSIGPSSSGYDLQISADGVNFTTLFSVGANVTRMVTGVANGSTYRLAGNTDEDVIVNWFRQCDDGGSGGGSGAQGPEGPQGYQGPAGQDGATGAQGPQGEAAQGGGDAHTLLAVSNLNDSSLDAAEGGDVRAKYIQNSEIVSTGGTVDSAGETFPSDGSLAVKSVDELYSIDGLRWKNGPDVWEMNESNDGLVATLISGDGTRTASEVTATTTGTISGGDFFMAYKDGSDNTIISFENYGKYWGCYSYSDSMQDYIFIYVPGEAQWLGSEVQNSKESDGVWQYVEKDGIIGEWNTTDLNSARGLALRFSYIPANTRIIQLKYFSSSYTYRIVYSNGNLYKYSSEDNYENGEYIGTFGEVFGVNLGGGYELQFNFGRHLLAIYPPVDSFKMSLWNNNVVMWNGEVVGPHFEFVSNYDPRPRFTGGTRTVLPIINNRGEIIGWNDDTPNRQYNKINNTYVNVFATSSVPNIWAPTTGGESGQMLQSNGNGAPIWSTLIKSVKITSDAYEALQTKDPNVLYLIVDSD